MASQLSKKAALPLAKILATRRNNVSNTGPWCVAWAPIRHFRIHTPFSRIEQWWRSLSCVGFKEIGQVKNSQYFHKLTSYGNTGRTYLKTKTLARFNLSTYRSERAALLIEVVLVNKVCQKVSIKTSIALFRYHGLTLIPSWISNYIHIKYGMKLLPIPKLQQYNRWSLGTDK